MFMFSVAAHMHFTRKPSISRVGLQRRVHVVALGCSRHQFGAGDGAGRLCAVQYIYMPSWALHAFLVPCRPRPHRAPRRPTEW